MLQFDLACHVQTLFFKYLSSGWSVFKLVFGVLSTIKGTNRVKLRENYTSLEKKAFNLGV